MRKASVIVCSSVACLAVVTARVTAGRIDEEPDRLCQMLFDEYVVRTGRINHSTEMAASHIIAERGRESGFWRNVLEELEQGNEQSESGCVRVLGKMLEMDATARDMLRQTEETGVVFQRSPSICLGGEVVEKLISRGVEADRFRVDQYAFALARARVPGACELFRSMLRDDAGKDYMDGAKFHAAVGLAQCGEPAGFEWLIANSARTTPTVSNARPERASSLNLDVCCIAALQQLSGRDGLRTREDCEAWWGLVDKESIARGEVRMVEE